MTCVVCRQREAVQHQDPVRERCRRESGRQPRDVPQVRAAAVHLMTAQDHKSIPSQQETMTPVNCQPSLDISQLYFVCHSNYVSNIQGTCCSNFPPNVFMISNSHAMWNVVNQNSKCVKLVL